MRGDAVKATRGHGDAGTRRDLADLRSLAERTVIRSVGMDERYCEWYVCMKCKFDLILGGFTYCPSCGRFIDRVVAKRVG